MHESVLNSNFQRLASATEITFYRTNLFFLSCILASWDCRRIFDDQTPGITTHKRTCVPERKDDSSRIMAIKLLEKQNEKILARNAPEQILSVFSCQLPPLEVSHGGGGLVPCCIIVTARDNTNTNLIEYYNEISNYDVT